MRRLASPAPPRASGDGLIMLESPILPTLAVPSPPANSLKTVGFVCRCDTEGGKGSS